ncbi:BREX-1 system adenine-specific DNA-methyltransferase PglX [Salinicoccus siamensis]|uniref:site-specific DNA-methyltransferase (adenine-specific) n=1 Tax=Salinicoccus siamensis TaxID=381830 RepID=A0ABV5Z2L1_9STAP
MNKSALRSFATNARRELLNKVKAKAMKIGITEEKIKQADIESSDAIFIDGRQLSSEEKTQRQNLIKRIEQKGFNQVMEEVAYTWFNRFTALRFMEVNEYLPSNVRVLSSSNPGDPIPDIIKEAMSLDFDIDKEWVYERKVKNENDKLFQYLIIKQCNDLYDYLPFMFEKIDDFTEILFPEGLLSKDSFLRQMTDIDIIPEEDWSNVEVIGWLYQYYIADEKDRVIKAKKKYKTEEIPFATQLFTPDWIVRYMVQNSLGRYWVENHPEDRELIKNWEFYLENPNQDENFEEEIALYLNNELKVEEIKCFDPAMGSGHILVYMFDELYEIYSRSGYLERDIPRLIIENNLYGLDIDERAYQLACFAIVMKAMKYNKRFLRSIKRHGLEMNFASLEETNELNDEDVAYIADENSGGNFNKVKAFIDQYKNAKTYGSLINNSTVTEKFIKDRLEYIQNNPAKDIFEEESRKKVLNILPKIIKQGSVLIDSYDILVTNPPYMGRRYMNKELSDFVKEVYPNSKSDTFSAFMEMCFSKVKSNGQLGFITPFVWMFISTYEQLRSIVVKEKNISSLIQLEYNAFPEAAVPVATFTLRNYNASVKGEYISLSNFTGIENQPVKSLEAVRNPDIDYRYSVISSEFQKIVGYPIAYWTSKLSRNIFLELDSLKKVAEPRVGLFTCNNDKFLRLWHEVDIKDVGFGNESHEQAQKSQKVWFPYNKGGKYRKWYGNNEYVVNFYNNGREISEYREKKGQSYYLPGNKSYFKSGVTWSFISSTNFGSRFFPKGFIFDVAGSSIFPNEDDIYYITAYLCSNVTFEFLKAQNPTMNFQVGNVANLPINIDVDQKTKDNITDLAKENIDISKNEWDSFETSWDFQGSPLLGFKNDSLKQAVENCKNLSSKAIERLKVNEQEINKAFINIFGLQEELSPLVSNKDITLRMIEDEQAIKSYISYAIGCIFGRYSLDQEGLIYAGGQFDKTKYQKYKADSDNIIPILPGTYFEDDIVSRFIDFVKVTFGKESLAENLDYIAETLGKKKNETAKETIRRYFINDFFKDHLQTYKKRPIYWLFTSGKQKAFNCLIYMHRYDSTTLGRIRTDYLHELQTRMDAEKDSLMNIIDGDSTSKEINQAKKDLKSLEKKIEELKDYDEVLHHMADQQIEIDLDDGVEVNYEKFKELLAKK